MSEKSHVISTLVEHKPGVLQNVASLLNRRGFNIDSITVGASEVEGLARMVFVVKGDEKADTVARIYFNCGCMLSCLLEIVCFR